MPRKVSTAQVVMKALRQRKEKCVFEEKRVKLRMRRKHLKPDDRFGEEGSSQ